MKDSGLPRARLSAPQASTRHCRRAFPERRLTEQTPSLFLGGYVDDDEDFGDYVIYTGHGGRDQRTGRQIEDQSPEASGNAWAATLARLKGFQSEYQRSQQRLEFRSPRWAIRTRACFTVSGHSPEPGRDGFVIQRFRLDALVGNYDPVAGGVVEADPAFSTTTTSRRHSRFGSGPASEEAVRRLVSNLWDADCGLAGSQLLRGSARSAAGSPASRPGYGVELVVPVPQPSRPTGHRRHRHHR